MHDGIYKSYYLQFTVVLLPGFLPLLQSVLCKSIDIKQDLLPFRQGSKYFK